MGFFDYRVGLVGNGRRRVFNVVALLAVAVVSPVRRRFVAALRVPRPVRILSVAWFATSIFAATLATLAVLPCLHQLWTPWSPGLETGARSCRLTRRAATDAARCVARRCRAPECYGAEAIVSACLWLLAAATLGFPERSVGDIAP